MNIQKISLFILYFPLIFLKCSYFYHQHTLSGSAVCTNYSWQPCPTCSQSDFDAFPSTTDRLAYGTDSDGEELIFIKQNHCNVNDRFGVISYATMIIVIVAVYLMIYLQKRKIVSFDESNDSTEDYSIEIKVRKFLFEGDVSSFTELATYRKKSTSTRIHLTMQGIQRNGKNSLNPILKVSP